jgi:alginate O-acetyltransferase complex protein AlgI
MLFNTIEYIFIFLPLVLIGYFSLTKFHLIEASKWFLILASLIFYSLWNVVNLPILIISIICNWIFVNAIWAANADSKRSAKNILLLGLIFNILYLGCFKYYDSMAIEINAKFSNLLPILNMALPLGVSFFTLTQIAYLVDAKEKLVPPQNFKNYTLFVLFFPHLLIGPILHHKEMMPQFDDLRMKVFSLENVASGLFLFAIGFLKKVLIADSLAPYVNYCFDESLTLSFIEAWQASIAFTCQLYFDFSGYIDMAIGSALMLNIKMPENFNSPLTSKSIIEFWERWHITLTNFLTTYIYTPLLYSFKKLTFSKSLLIVFVTFFISGIWHGAALTFVMFGALHGFALSINHVWRRNKWWMPAFIGRFLTLVFIFFTLVLFRANSVENALKLIEAMLGLSGHAASINWKDILVVNFSNLENNNFGFSYDIFLLILVSFVLIFKFDNSTTLTKKFRKIIGKNEKLK